MPELMSPSLNITWFASPILRVAFCVMASKVSSGRLGKVLINAALNFSSSEVKLCWGDIALRLIRVGPGAEMKAGVIGVVGASASDVNAI